MKNPLLYEISTQPWLDELSRKSGKEVRLADVPDSEWERFADLGFNFVWLMGMWTKSPQGRAVSLEREELQPVYDSALPGWSESDIIGSPYSIQDYAPDPSIGSWEDLQAVRKKLKKRGLGLILDFVPNHMGPDHPWVEKEPQRFVLGPPKGWEENPKAFFRQESGKQEFSIARGRDPYFDPWPDTAQLNYFETDTRQAMIEQLKRIAKHCDGVRCDMAMLVLNDIFASTWKDMLTQPRPAQEFWAEARPQLPEFLLIAEAYWGTEGRLLELGFDYVYDKTLYDRCLGAPAREIRAHLTADIGYQQHLVRFLENHDEPRAAKTFSPEAHGAAATLMLTLPGLKLINHGQLEGRQVHLPVQMLRTRAEEADAKIQGLYEHLLQIRRHPNFSQGEWRLLDTHGFEDGSHENLIAYCWRQAGDRHLVVVNPSPHFSQARIPLGHLLGEDAAPDWRLTDLVDGQTYDRSGLEMTHPGLHVILEGYRSHVFALEALA